MKYALPRTTLLAIGIAAAGLFALPTATYAKDTKELTALKAALQTLTGSSDVVNATANNLAAAVTKASTDNPKLRIGNIAGEALKYNINDPGDEVAGSIITAVTDPTARNKEAANASVRSTTGVSANGTNVPLFASQFVSSDSEAITLARLATKSSIAIGAIIGGQALDYASNPSDAAEAALAIAAMGDSKLKKATQQIAQYTSVFVTNSGAFANALATTSKIALKVGTGVAAGNPQEADQIINAMLAGPQAATVVKTAQKFAKSVGLVADVEQVAFIARTLGGVISSKQVNSTAKALSLAISKRTTLNGTGDNNIGNKAEEYGEIIGTFIDAIEENPLIGPTFDIPKKAATLVFNVAKTMFKAAKVKTIKSISQTSKDLQNALVAKPGNFAASLAFTLRQMNAAGDISNEVFQAIVAKLTSKSVNAIGGKPFAAAILDGLNKGFAGDGVVIGDPNQTGYEDGQNIGPVLDPETDTRNS
jgi:hypothetical protein